MCIPNQALSNRKQIPQISVVSFLQMYENPELSKTVNG